MYLSYGTLAFCFGLFGIIDIVFRKLVGYGTQEIIMALQFAILMKLTGREE